MTVHLRWPRDRFYWAVLEGPPCHGELPVGLHPALADEVPDQDLHAVCTPMGEGRILACAVPRQLLAQLDRRVLSLAPESVPEFATGRTEDLHLLIGAMEPGPIRRARRARHVVMLAAILIATGLICIGMARRETRWDTLAASAVEARERVIASVVPTGTDLSHELSSRRRSSGSPPAPVMDAAVELSRLLAAWPAQTPSKPLSLAVGGSGVQFAVCVEGDSTPFATAFKPPDGWTLDEPRLNTTGGLTRLNFQLRRPEGASHE